MPPKTSNLTGLFQSRKAIVACTVAVVVLLVVVVVAVRPGSDGGGAKSATAGPAAQQGPQGSSSPSAGGVTTSTVRGGTPGTSKAGTAGPGATDIVGGPVPAGITVQGTTKVKDGQPVTLRIKANPGSLAYGFDARLCQGNTPIRFDAEMSPLLAGKCVSKPLSPVSDDYIEVIGKAPYDAVEGVFRVGVGTDTFTMRNGTPVTITCGPDHPCEIAVKIQYPDGYGFRTYPITYA